MKNVLVGMALVALAPYTTSGSSKMNKALVGLLLASFASLASGCGGSDLPPEVEEARREAVEVADEQYDAAVATAEAQYRNSLEKTQNRYDSAVATAEAKYYTDAVRKRHLDNAKESRDSSIEYAKAHYEEMLEHAESERVKRIEDAEERSGAGSSCWTYSDTKSDDTIRG